MLIRPIAFKPTGVGGAHARKPRRPHWRSRRTTTAVIAFAAALTTVAAVLTTSPDAHAALAFEVQSLDGTGNNQANPTWGKAGTNYSRVTPARYADGRSAPATGPNSRFISNRIINDVAQNVFSEHRVSQWGNVWGQFVDHTVGLRDDAGETANIPFDRSDPMESFTNDLGVIPFNRSRAAPGTGVNNPREQINTEDSYLDADAVYGPTTQRLEWLREGPVDNNMANNGARLLMPGGLLPRRDSRGNAAAAPDMAIDGRLRAQPTHAAVAGDVRANENIALTVTHTLFAREHNRIVGMLPNSLSNEEKFQIARRIVIAEQQYVTYNEFLPSMGVSLPFYTGYKPGVNANLTNEFATVGYRAHSQIHGEIEVESEAADYTPAQLDAIKAQGVEVTVAGGEITFVIPLNVAFFNPDLVGLLHAGALLKGIGSESEYNNDEMIDNQLRSVLFQVPVSGNPDCLDGPTLPQCFKGVLDLGAIDVERGRDHGIPNYNDLRRAYGLAPRPTFRAITGEASENFPADPTLPPGNEVNDPNSLDFLRLSDIDGANVAVGAENGATKSVRRTPLAARLKAVYGSVDKVDAFAGMISEPHVPGTEFGELQLAIWTKQFLALRDGDRFFYGNDPGLSSISAQYGIDFHHSLAELIAANTDIPLGELNDNVFLVPDAALPAAQCSVDYKVFDQWNGAYRIDLKITNLAPAATNGWNLRWTFPDGQTFLQVWNGNGNVNGVSATVNNASWNAQIPGNGGTLADVGFNARWDNATNAKPPNFTLNGKRCARG